MNDRMFRTLVKTYKPKGYTLYRLHGNAAKTADGVVSPGEKTIKINMDLNEPWRSLVFLHEVGHIRCRHNSVKIHSHWREEYEAWKWALKVWRDHKIPLKRELLHSIKSLVADAVIASGDMPEDKVKHWLYGNIR